MIIFFQKLNNSINKDLYQLGVNFQKNTEQNHNHSSKNDQFIDYGKINTIPANKNMELEEGSTLAPLFTVSNKIKLKNLQMKIGNSIREAQKIMKKNLQGSISPLQNQIQELQEELALLHVKNTQLNVQNSLLKAIKKDRNSVISESQSELQQMKNKINNLYKQVMKDQKDESLIQDKFLKSFQLTLDLGRPLSSNLKGKSKKYYANKSTKQLLDRKYLKKIDLDSLKEILKNQLKTVEHLKKQNQEKEKIYLSLCTQNLKHSSELQNLRKSHYNQNKAEFSLKMEEKLELELEQLQRQQCRLEQLIKKQNMELSEQYNLNKESKQKIADRKYQEAKEVKVLEEEVAKCKEQLRQIKAKCRRDQLYQTIKN